MRIQILFAILFLSQVTFSGAVQKSLSELLKNLQDPDLHLDDEHRRTEHDDDKRNHWFDINVEFDMLVDSECEDLYTSTCKKLVDLGCSNPCDETNSLNTTGVTWESNGKICIIEVSFLAEEAGVIERFYEECDSCVGMSFDGMKIDEMSDIVTSERRQLSHAICDCPCGAWDNWKRGNEIHCILQTGQSAPPGYNEWPYRGNQYYTYHLPVSCGGRVSHYPGEDLCIAPPICDCPCGTWDKWKFGNEIHCDLAIGQSAPPGYKEWPYKGRQHYTYYLPASCGGKVSDYYGEPLCIKSVWLEDGCSSGNNYGEENPQWRNPDSVGYVRCCSMDGNSCTSPIHCFDQDPVSYATAYEICANQGRRLCTKKELRSNVCCKTGGLCDHRIIWTKPTEPICDCPCGHWDDWKRGNEIHCMLQNGQSPPPGHAEWTYHGRQYYTYWLPSDCGGYVAGYPGENKCMN